MFGLTFVLTSTRCFLVLMNYNFGMYCIHHLLYRDILSQTIWFFSTEFKVTVPDSLVVTLGEAVVLPCSFSVGNAWQPEDIVITWQRGLEVVHSFYYNRDQLKRQSKHYASRTRLYHSEMQKGNASLRLENVSVEDVGNYMCSVSSQLGSEKKSFPLKVAGKYNQWIVQIGSLHYIHN